MSDMKVAFEMGKIRLSLGSILPVRQLKNVQKNIRRYRTIRASIKEVGLVEPLMVHPQKDQAGVYLLLDGHLRYFALKELGETEADCIVATDDESFTYNARVSRLAPIQEHKMWRRLSSLRVQGTFLSPVPADSITLEQEPAPQSSLTLPPIKFIYGPSDMSREAAEMTVEAVTLEVPDSKTIKLKWPEGYDPVFKTGQFITCFWPDEPNYKRAYSLSSCALDRGFFEFTVRRDGKMGTRLVDWIKAGAKLMVLPPAGKFLPVYEPEKHLICIAGGSGVTPFRAYVREATRQKYQTKITVLYSVRTTNDIIFNDEFRRLEKENPNFKFDVTCTRLAPHDPWPGRRGRIDAAWLKVHVGDLANTVFYACGPTTLVEFAEGVVFELGAPKAQMKTEKWG